VRCVDRRQMMDPIMISTLFSGQPKLVCWVDVELMGGANLSGDGSTGRHFEQQFKALSLISSLSAPYDCTSGK
jgi:hypothetical protein